MSIKVLNESPRIVMVSDFLTEDQCAHLVAMATPGMKRAQTVDIETGEGSENDYRTGLNYGFARGQDLIIKEIEAMIAETAGVRAEQLETIQVNKYAVGDQFKDHCDWFDTNVPGHLKQMKLGGQRVMSSLMYLNEPEEGGETFFKALGLKVKPARGTLLIWSNVDPGNDSKPDPRVLHASKPILRGEKLAATCWIRERAFDGSEEAAHAKAKEKQAETEAELRRKLDEIQEKNIVDGHQEILEICRRRKLRLLPLPRLANDGRIGAVLDLVPDTEGRA
jgi:prolyl 4-hydroxylase